MAARTFSSDFIDDDSIEPLFGEYRPRDRYINVGIGIFTALMVAGTVCYGLLQAFRDTGYIKERTQNVFLCIAIFLNCISVLVIIRWYRMGELDPKFRYLIYYNALSISFLCGCGIWFFFEQAKDQKGT